MRDSTWNALEQKFAAFPFLRGTGASTDEVDEVSRILARPLPQDYREFLRRYGAAIVGAYPIFGVREVEPLGTSWSVIKMNDHFRKINWSGVTEWVIFSNDLAGNPYGFDDDGSVWISDEEFGEISRVYDDFEQFLRDQCLKLQG